jgi:hypothetical protein
VTKSPVWRLSIDQPTTILENASMTAQPGKIDRAQPRALGGCRAADIVPIRERYALRDGLTVNATKREGDEA